MKKTKLTLDKLNVVRLNNTFQIFGGGDAFDSVTDPIGENKAGSSQPCIDARARYDARNNRNRQIEDASSEPCKTIRRPAQSTKRCAG